MTVKRKRIGKKKKKKKERATEVAAMENQKDLINLLEEETAGSGRGFGIRCADEGHGAFRDDSGAWLEEPGRL